MNQQKKVDELRRSMIKSHIEQRNRIDGLLTQEQREQWRAMRGWSQQDDEE